MSARVGLSLIGTPDGFESVSIGASKSMNIGRKVDLDNSVINILPNTDILVVRRDIEHTRLLTYITYYRFAKEIKTSRTGSFYGGTILFENFVPNKISFILNVLGRLAETIKRFCIDPQENRFHSHFNPAWIESMIAEDPSLLEVDSYQAEEIQPARKISNKRCFLLLEKSLPNYYERFLSNVILDDEQTGSNLSTHHLVYTSRHEEVIKEVRLRKGLIVETPASLSAQYSQASVAQDKPQEPPINSEPDKNHPPNPSQTKTPESVSANLSEGVPSPSNQLVNQAVYDKTELNSGAADADVAQTAASSKIVVTFPSGEPSDRREQNEEISDGAFVAFARWAERRFKRRRAGNEVEGERHISASFILILILIASLAGVFILYPIFTRVWSILTGNSRSSIKTNIYYNGCLKSKNGIDESSDLSSKCQPGDIANEFLSQLINCNEFSEYLRTVGDKSAQDAYRESIKNKIIESILTNPRNNPPGKNNAFSVNTLRSTEFAIDLDFDKSMVCLRQILEDPNSVFSSHLTDNTPPAVVSNESPTPNQSGPIIRLPPNPKHTPTPPATPKPTRSPGATPNRKETPVVTSSPKIPVGRNPNSDDPLGQPSDTLPAEPQTNQPPNQTSPQSGTSNKTQPAGPPQVAKPRRKQGKRGRN